MRDDLHLYRLNYFFAKHSNLPATSIPFKISIKVVWLSITFEALVWFMTGKVHRRKNMEKI